MVSELRTGFAKLILTLLGVLLNGVKLAGRCRLIDVESYSIQRIVQVEQSGILLISGRLAQNTIERRACLFKLLLQCFYLVTAQLKVRLLKTLELIAQGLRGSLLIGQLAIKSGVVTGKRHDRTANTWIAP